jgi:hypothetical protein
LVGDLFQAGVIDSAIHRDILIPVFLPLKVNARSRADLGQPEVHQLGLHGSGHNQNVCRLDIPVRESAGVGVGQPLSTFLHDPESLIGPEWSANVEEIPEIAPLNELHDEEKLIRDAVLIDRKDGDNIRMPDGHAELAFAQEQGHLLFVHRPFVAENLDRHNLPYSGIVTPIDPSKAPGCDLVEQPIATEEVAIGVPLEQFVGLPGSEIPLPLQETDHLRSWGFFVIKFDQAFAKLFFGHQPKPDCELPDPGCIEIERHTGVGGWGERSGRGGNIASSKLQVSSHRRAIEFRTFILTDWQSSSTWNSNLLPGTVNNG